MYWIPPPPISGSDTTLNNLHALDILEDSAELFLFGREEMMRSEAGDPEIYDPGVEFALANRFIRNLHYLMRVKPQSAILVHMKTRGGDWFEGMAIYDAIKACPQHVTILAYTPARSMSSIIACAADRLVLMPHSQFMIHKGTIGVFGTGTHFETEAVEYHKSHRRMMEIYVDTIRRRRPERGPETIRTQLESLMAKHEDVYWDSHDAVKFGWADAVFGDGGLYNWSDP